MHKAADGAADKFCRGKQSVHGQVQARRSAEPGPDQGLCGLADPLGDGHIAVNAKQTLFLFQIPEALPEIPDIIVEGEFSAGLYVFLHIDLGLHRSRRSQQQPLAQAEHAQAQLRIQDAGHRGHDHGDGGVEHAGYGVALLGKAIGDQIGVQAFIGQIIHRADTAAEQGKEQIQRQTERMLQQIQAEKQIDHRAEIIQLDDHRLAAEIVQIWGDQYRQNDPRQRGRRGKKGHHQGTARIVKHHKAQSKAHGYAADSADHGAQGDNGEVLGPKSILHVFHAPRHSLYR